MMHFVITLALAAIGVLSGAGAAAPPRLLLIPSDGSGEPMVLNTTTIPNATPGADGKGRDAYLAVVSHATPQSFHVYGPGDPVNCTADGGVATVRATAALHGCRYATNAGPFTIAHGGCMGATISDGKTLSSDWATTEQMFGLTSNGTWVLGNVGSAGEAASLGIAQLVTGFKWLVANGENVVTTKGGEAAPRTAAGVDAHGRLMLLDVDGCEECSKGKGPTLHELGDLLVSLGARAAVNMDGGGSSTVIAGGKLINHPTCDDVLKECERKVATILCVT